MTWGQAIPIIAQYGLPVAEALWRKWESGQNPTNDDWKELNTLVARQAQDRMLAALQRAGIDPQSEKGKEFLALAS